MEVHVYTTQPEKDSKAFKAPASFIKIIRVGNLKKKGALSRYWNYLVYYATVSAKLAFWRPISVLYYETLSAFPSIIYKRIFYNKSRLAIHYHEYTSLEEYKNGMLLNKWGHRLEKSIYPFADWISQCNADRMSFFLEDNQGIKIPHTHILPNFPPENWIKMDKKANIKIPLKVIYVGAFSLDTMYVQEFASWVIRQNGNIIWDIFSVNITKEAFNYINSLGSDFIRLRGSADYYSLPLVLAKYDVGVILYKGHIPNYVYNAPNKLFEYWACGLDVWFPVGLKSSLPYITHGVYPKVVALDFENLGQSEFGVLIDREGYSFKASTYYSEAVYKALAEVILA